MATVEAIQSALDSAETGRLAVIHRKAVVSATLDEFYATALATSSATPGTSRWVRTTSSDSAATQAAAILAGLV